MTSKQAKKLIEKKEGYVLDVRSKTEYDEGHIEGADHIMVGMLKKRLDEVDANKTVIVQCQAGARSAIAASLLKANGFENLVNLTGGYEKWKEELSV